MTASVAAVKAQEVPPKHLGVALSCMQALVSCPQLAPAVINRVERLVSGTSPNKTFLVFSFLELIPSTFLLLFSAACAISCFIDFCICFCYVLPRLI